MVVMAHPDDSEFACGGTVATLARGAGGGGRHRRRDQRQQGGPRIPVSRRSPSPACARRSSAAPRPSSARANRSSSGFPTGALRNDDELRGLVVRQIRIRRPELVLTWDGFRPGFNHRDPPARRPRHLRCDLPGGRRPPLLPRAHKEEELEPHRPAALLLCGSDAPDYHVDIEPVLRTKVRAVLAHRLADAWALARGADAHVARARPRAAPPAGGLRFAGWRAGGGATLPRVLPPRDPEALSPAERLERSALPHAPRTEACAAASPAHRAGARASCQRARERALP